MFSLQIHSIFFLVLVAISTQYDGMNDTIFDAYDGSEAEYLGPPHSFIIHPWPGGTVYYEFDDDYSQSVIDSLHYYMSLLTKHVPCVRFAKARRKTRTFVRWRTHRYFCFAIYGGSPSYAHNAYLARRCRSARVYQQLLIFILGMSSMTQHPDRDQHIRIIWRNILSRQKKFFKKATGPTFGIPYDKDSITQFNADVRSKNRKRTIIHRRNLPFGRTENMSSGDILALKRIYKCA